MNIIGLSVENFKRLRVVEINPRGHLVQVTGKNGQGKSSVLDAIWAGLVGARATPERPVRKGATSCKIRLDLGDVLVTRHIASDGTHNLTVTNAAGGKILSPQAMLDALLGELTFDPLEFAGMKPKTQVEILRRVAKIDLDVDSMNAANQADYAERTGLNREIKNLEAEISTITVQDKLPKAKIDEAAIVAKIGQVDSINAAARKHDELKRAAVKKVDDVALTIRNLRDSIADYKAQIERLQKEIAVAEVELKAAADKAEALPFGVYAQTTELTEELSQAQLVNREIDKRTRRDVLSGQLNAKRKAADQLTRNIEGREEEKRSAVAKGKMPVEGLSFDDDQVMFNGIPIEQLGEAEKIKISTSIAMAVNPKLRILRIVHGEALDEDSLQVLAEMAEKHDYQIWMSRVDSSGQVGIVMEDGMVKDNAAVGVTK